MPRVSVILAVFNGERFLTPAIESILSQTFGDLELIVVDDGSTDGTAGILRGIRDSRVRCLTNQRNEGIYASLNKGLQLASGEYVCPMDADDIALPMRIQREVAFLDQNPECAMVGSHVRLIDELGIEIGVETPPTADKKIRSIMFIHNPFIHATMMIRSSVLQTVGGYDDRFLYNGDYDLWLRIASRYRFANLSEILLLRRIHAKAVTIEHELELVRNRIKTLHHAILHYYHKPVFLVYLVRPVLAYTFRRIQKLLVPLLKR